MAKRQNFVVGSTNPNTESRTVNQLNTAWNRYEVLRSGVLDGVLNAISDYSNDSSNEIANAIQSITGSQPTGQSQSELAGALNQMRQDIETSSLTFKGYIATSAPSSSTYGLVEGNLWINSATLPTSFPVAASDIKVWDGTAWVTQSDSYTVANFDFWRNVNDNEGYYWFGGQWVVMSTDMSTTYFTLNQTSGKWEIKSSVNLPGTPTCATPTSSSSVQAIVNRDYVDNIVASSGTGRNVGDIFYTMRNDNELNGAVECDGSTYNTTDFTGAQSIGNLLADGKVPYVSMAVYASTITTQGWCDKFGWDGAGNIQFKVPTLNAYIWQKLQTSVVGNGTPMRIVDLTQGGTTNFAYKTGNLFGFSDTPTSPGVGSEHPAGVVNDPTNSGLVAGSASDISQQRCMVQLATSATDEALETCTSVLADVADLKDHRVIAFQAPTAQNNYTWYRKYADGWVEQGGIITTIAGATTINLLVSMADTNYFPIASIADSGAGGTGANCKISCWVDSNSIIKTTVRNEANNPVTAKVCWEVKGVAA